MRTIWEIVTEEGRAREYVNSEGVIYDREEVEKLVKKGMIEVIDYILTRPDMIYVAQEEVEEPYGILSEALYSYEKFTVLKQQL